MRAVMGLMFFPRGGSAQVARYLARSLPGLGRDARVRVARRPRGAVARRDLLRGLDVRPLDYDEARRGARPAGRRPALPPLLRGPAGRAGPGLRRRRRRRLRAPGRGPGSASSREAGAADADLLHLHHLTPINEAAERAFPDVPADRPPARHRAADAARDRRGPAGRAGTHAAEWAERMRRWARGCERLLVLLARRGAARARPARRATRSGWCGRPTASTRRASTAGPLTGAARLAHWRRWLVEEPRGWDEAGEPGSVPTPTSDLEPFARRRAGARSTSGRYTEVKRIPLLIRAHARARERFEPPRAARAARRLPGRVGGRAPARGRARDRATRTCSWPAGAATRTCPTA